MPPRDPRAKRLKELVDLGEVQVHVPELVLQELRTGLANEFSIALKRGKRNERYSHAERWLDDERREHLEQLERGVKKLRKEKDASIEASVDNLRSMLQISVIPTPDSGITEVLNDYLQGNGAFKSEKNRADFPDAFILLAIKRYVGSLQGNLHAVVADAKFGEALSNCGIVIHKKVEDFLALGYFDKEELALRMKTYLEEHESLLSGPIGDFIGACLDGTEISGNFPSDNADATVGAVNDILQVEIKFDEADAIDSRTLVVPVSVELDLYLDLFVEKYEYWGMPDKQSVHYEINDGDWNDHYVWALRPSYELRVNTSVFVHVERHDGEFDVVDVELASEPEFVEIT